MSCIKDGLLIFWKIMYLCLYRQFLELSLFVFLDLLTCRRFYHEYALYALNCRNKKIFTYTVLFFFQSFNVDVFNLNLLLHIMNSAMTITAQHTAIATEINTA